MTHHKPQSVTLIEMLHDVGIDMNPMDKAMLFANDAIFPSYFRNGLRLMTDTRITAFTENSVKIVDAEQNASEIPADTIILALGYVPENRLYKELSGKYGDVYLLGDARKVSKIVNAIYQANTLAREN